MNTGLITTPSISNKNRKWAILGGEAYKQPYFFENLVKRCISFAIFSKILVKRCTSFTIFSKIFPIVSHFQIIIQIMFFVLIFAPFLKL